MTTRKYSSRSQQTTLVSQIVAGATSATVVSASALLGGITISASQTFTVVIDPDTALEEIVDVTSVSTNNLIITRGRDGSTAQDHSAGAVVRHMAIGRDYRESNLHIEATGAYNDGTATHDLHGVATGEGDVVGTAKTQTLTNKTLTSPTVSGLTLSDASIVFEGTTADAFETTLTVTDPTADRTITLPNVTGTVAILDATQTLSNKTLGSALAAGTFKITGLGDPTLAQDAATKNYVDTGANSQVAAAATSATSAATSATSSATSASAAATSATSAATSATSSATSATASASSATAAASSATAAASSATAAATSATSAAASATAAASSATSLSDSSIQISFQVFG
jgi:hypothetical protein